MAPDPFTVEAWTYLAIDILIVATRVVARGRLTGWKNIAADDILMVVAIVRPPCDV